VASSQPIQILLVEPDPVQVRRLARMLKGGGVKFRLTCARTLSDSKRHFLKKKPDVAVMNLSLPDAEGLAVVREAQQAAPGMPLVTLTGTRDDSLAAEVLRLGAQDVLVNSELNSGCLARALHYALARQHAQATLHTLSLLDELTGLHNRRGFISLAEQGLKLALRRGQRSALVFIDVDDLKYVNDSFGHKEGDYALKQAAGLLRECFRESDIIGRLGGDEFCALLLGTSDHSDLPIRKRLTQLFDKYNAGSHSLYRLSISVGIVDVSGPNELEQQIARADAFMYEQKRGKQNRVERPAGFKEHRLV